MVDVTKIIRFLGMICFTILMLPFHILELLYTIIVTLVLKNNEEGDGMKYTEYWKNYKTKKSSDIRHNLHYIETGEWL